jgi:excisionase family DNA binding protein
VVSDDASSCRTRPVAPRGDDASAPEDDVLDAGGAAALLKVGKAAIYSAASAGRIPHRYVGKHLRFSRAALMRWLDSCSGTGAQEGQ